MRYRIAVGVVVVALLAPRMLAAQDEKPAPASPDIRAAELKTELLKNTYTAKRAIPESDNIFVENGRVVEALFTMEREGHATALESGKTTSISKVVLLDRAIQVFFANDKCALLILTKGERRTADMAPPELLELARQGIGALFTAKKAADAT